MLKFISKRNILISIGILIAILILYIILPVSIPLIAALLTAMVLEPSVRFLQKHSGLGRKFAVLIVFLTFVILIGLAGYFITTKVITEAISFVEDAPKYINEISKDWFDAQDRFIEAAKELPEELVEEINNRGEDFLINVKNDLLAFININNVKALLTNIPNFLVSFLVYLIALFLFLLDLPQLRKGFYNRLTEKTAEKVHFMTTRLSFVLLGFIKAQFLVSVIIFAVSLIGLLLISPKVALVMAVVLWIIDFIPIIGSIAVLGPWALFHLLAGNLALGSKLAILAAVLLIIRRTVEPKMMGTHIGLSPLSTLIAMYLGLKLLGLAGFIIGPLLLIGYNTAKEAGIIKANFKI
ncbi:sporulation integral membrane protein YtvI [Mesobacillus foraminis]|uniref:Sporulation integral membrane protein YtvI n=1 Tax=Mesobacillus foraminis TaxID=279826 RepID=A0A4R2BGU2_9BACI|nr:sporulation integral membrane protein YtvI [Mesobacillus foraminis]TCN25743.1 sporulation integral membrane protein YtvI [Mesobacillus foraminis]